MPTFRTENRHQQEAAAFETKLRAAGLVERPGATQSTLRPGEYTKRTSGSDPNSFSGVQTVTFEIRES
jgi:hypothetical protein